MSLAQLTCIFLLIFWLLCILRIRGNFLERHYKLNDIPDPLKSSRPSLMSLQHFSIPPSHFLLPLSYSPLNLPIFCPHRQFSIPKAINYHPRTRLHTDQRRNPIHTRHRSRVQHVPSRHTIHQSLKSSLFWDVCAESICSC